VPIRSNRGRAAVYRKLWGWPMRSPKHLIISAVIGALLITGAGIVVPKIIGKAPTQVAAGSTGRPGTATSSLNTGGSAGSGGVAPAPSSAATSLPTRLPSPPQTPSSAPASTKALDTARAWTEAWVFHPVGTTAEQWLDRLRPLTTPEYLGVMSSIEPANVPAKEITGPVKAVSSYAKSVVAEVPTDAGKVLITVIDTEDGWRVANYERGS
jgi:hypothetical protein